VHGLRRLSSDAIPKLIGATNRQAVRELNIDDSSLAMFSNL
jgi:hypothetical protein